MKNPVIFTASNSFNYARAAIARSVKAGFFYSSAKGGFSILISGGLSLPSPKKGTLARASGLFDGGIWQAAFSCLQTSNSPHHAQRNHRAARAATNSTHTTGQSRNHPGQDGDSDTSHAKEFCRLQKVNGAASNDFTRFLTFAAIPPAAFSTHLLLIGLPPLKF